MSEWPEMGAGSLFFELAGDLRLSILMKLSQKQYRLSQIATDLDATLQEAHRNMLRLIESGLVSKDSEGDIVLTPRQLYHLSQAMISCLIRKNTFLNIV